MQSSHFRIIRKPAIVAMLARTLFFASANAGPIIAFDQSDNLFVAAPNSNAIVKFAPDGSKSAFAAGIEGSLAFDAANNLFVGVSDATGTIFKFASDGTRSTFASGVGNPSSLAFDAAGNLFVFDLESGSIFKFTPDGNKSRFVEGKKPPGQMFANSTAVACDRAGNLFAGDSGKNTIFKFAPDGTRKTFATGIRADALAFDAKGNLGVADFFGNKKLFRFAPDGARNVVKVELNAPEGLAFDSAGNLFVYDAPQAIVKITPDGTKSAFAENRPAPPPVESKKETEEEPGVDSSVGLPKKYAENYLIASRTISPDKKFAVIYPTKDDEDFPEGANYVVSLEPFAILTKLETKQPYFKNESHGGLSADWSEDRTVALITLERKWGPGDIFLVEFKDEKLTRTTNLLARMHDVLAPDYKKAKAAPYNDHDDFIFETEAKPICELDGSKQVRINALATTDPKGGGNERVWDGRLKAIWDIPQAEFTSQKVMRKFADVRKHEE